MADLKQFSLRGSRASASTSECAANCTAYKLHSIAELDHGHHVLRIYCKSLLARLYEKFGTFLRLEICVNRLKDLGPLI
jgi:hypothetical protein